MIEELTKHIWETIAVGAIGIGIYFFQKYNTQIETRVNNFIERVSAMLKSNQLKQKEFAQNLNEHSDHMGKATKAINGDMLQIKESVFGLKSELSNELMAIQKESSKLSREFEALGSRFELAVEGFDQRYGRLIELQKKVDTCMGKIIHVEESTGKINVIATNNKADIKATKDVLERFAHELRVLRAKQKRGET